jgi:DNA helicase-2/ATP-dependent DNA helicase PcrA
VFLIGMEDGVFPHMRSLTEPDELEEERRLAYVGITRAKERLFVSHAWSRMLFGTTQYNPPSRFLEEIPAELVDSAGGKRRRRSQNSDWGNGGWSASRSLEHRERVVDAALSSRSSAVATTTGAESMGLRVGDDVRHGKFGEGVVLALEGSGDKTEAVVRFPDAGEKRLLLAWSPLRKV